MTTSAFDMIELLRDIRALWRQKAWKRRKLSSQESDLLGRINQMLECDLPGCTCREEREAALRTDAKILRFPV